jgi:hypothetical protein
MNAVHAWTDKWAKVTTLNMATAKRVFIFFIIPFFSVGTEQRIGYATDLAQKKHVWKIVQFNGLI